VERSYLAFWILWQNLFLEFSKTNGAVTASCSARLYETYDPQIVQTNLALAPFPSLRCSVILPHLLQSQPFLK